MSLEATTIRNKTVLFTMFPKNPFNPDSIGAEDTVTMYYGNQGRYRAWKKPQFSQALEIAWEAYWLGNGHVPKLYNHSFEADPHFVGITEWYLSNGWGTNIGSILPQVQEKTLYVLKGKMCAVKSPKPLHLYSVLEEIITKLTNNKMKLKERNVIPS